MPLSAEQHPELFSSLPPELLKVLSRGNPMFRQVGRSRPAGAAKSEELQDLRALGYLGD